MNHYYIFTNHNLLYSKLWHKVVINIDLFSLFSLIINRDGARNFGLEGPSYTFINTYIYTTTYIDTYLYFI